MFFKSQAGLSLCALCLKEFYNLYDNEGCGIITNKKSGALLYDLLKWAGNDIELPQEIKKEVWKNCIEEYKVTYDKTIEDKDKHKKLREDLYKVRLIEVWLNKAADEDKRVLPTEIPIPKLNSQYHKFRLFREE